MSIDTDPQQQEAASPQLVVGRTALTLGVNMTFLGKVPLIACSVFLAASAVFHFASPQRAEVLLAQIMPVQVTGACLVLLGGWCLFYPSLGATLVGVPVLLSGVARLFAPQRMIQINRWTSRLMHALLMLVGALGCFLMAVYSA